MISKTFPAIVLLTVTIFGGESHVTEGKAYTQYNFPNPQKDPLACGHGGRLSWVCDPGEYLSIEEARKLDSLSNQMFRKTDCTCRGMSPCGFRMAVAVVPMISGYGKDANSNDALEATMRFASYLNSVSWNFGLCNNNLVTVIAIAERQVWTKLGTCEHISDWSVTKIYEENKPYLTDGEYGTGLIKMFESLFQSYQLGVITKKKESPMLTSGQIAGIIIVAIIGFFVVLSCCTDDCENEHTTRGRYYHSGRSWGHGGRSWGHGGRSGGGCSGGGGGCRGGGGGF